MSLLSLIAVTGTILTLKKTLVERKLGVLEKEDLERVTETLGKTLEL